MSVRPASVRPPWPPSSSSVQQRSGMSRKPAASEDELHSRRLSHAQWLAGLLADPGSVASLAVAAYAELLDDLALDVAVEAHREFHTGVLLQEPPPPPQQQQAPARPGGPSGVRSGPATDVFGAVHPGTATDIVTCMSCGRNVQAGKFAYHLEKCLGKGRQPGTRQTSRRNA